MNHPLCFVLMPFGKKPDAGGLTIDFDAVYNEVVAPAIDEAGLEPIRADEEPAGGFLQKPVHEQWVLCEYAVADLTLAGAGVLYELGLRHALRPGSTLAVFCSRSARPPFEGDDWRALPYQLTASGAPADIPGDRAALAQRLIAGRNAAGNKPPTGLPLLELLDGHPGIASDKTDVFREQVRYSSEIKSSLENARKQGIDAVRRIEEELSGTGGGRAGGLKDRESGAVIDLFLSYRSLKAWGDMIALVGKMPRPLAATVLVQEQYALALNRAGESERAEKVIEDLIVGRAPSSETYGILGRVYKDRWEAALKTGNGPAARGLLQQAIEAYLRGFEADWRDALPGINAVTLMELQEPPDPRRRELIPVVSYGVERRIASGHPDYWDHATHLELAVLAKDAQKARQAAEEALASVREPWEPETTARNLRLIREARERRQEHIPWARAIEDALLQRAKA